jgi:hypothetical protein
VTASSNDGGDTADARQATHSHDVVVVAAPRRVGAVAMTATAKAAGTVLEFILATGRWVLGRSFQKALFFKKDPRATVRGQMGTVRLRFGRSTDKQLVERLAVHAVQGLETKVGFRHTRCLQKGVNLTERKTIRQEIVGVVGVIRYTVILDCRKRRALFWYWLISCLMHVPFGQSVRDCPRRDLRSQLWQSCQLAQCAA